MAPELLNTIDAKELRDLALRVQEFQQAKKLSDNALYRKFAGIGSTKTYKRILANDLKELSLETQLTNYRAVVALMDAAADTEDEEEIFEDLAGPLELKRAFMETSLQSSLGRVIIVEGDTGSGKTVAARLLVKKNGGRCAWIEASAVWNDTPSALLTALLKALGRKEIPLSNADRLDACVEALKASRKAVVIDEAHHLGPVSLNTLKTLLNQTPGEFILCAMGTLWNRLERAAYQECRQLTGNRLAERIKLQLRENDLGKILERRLTGLNGDLKAAIKVLMENAPKNGNLAFVRGACKRAIERADGDPVTLEIFTAAVSAEVARR